VPHGLLTGKGGRARWPCAGCRPWAPVAAGEGGRWRAATDDRCVGGGLGLEHKHAL
jgi:hypothetical protein